MVRAVRSRSFTMDLAQRLMLRTANGRDLVARVRSGRGKSRVEQDLPAKLGLPSLVQVRSRKWFMTAFYDSLSS
jgi:hypothetical protein